MRKGRAAIQRALALSRNDCKNFGTKGLPVSEFPCVDEVIKEQALSSDAHTLTIPESPRH
jgi:hypothetical protein